MQIWISKYNLNISQDDSWQVRGDDKWDTEVGYSGGPQQGPMWQWAGPWQQGTYSTLYTVYITIVHVFCLLFI